MEFDDEVSRPDGHELVTASNTCPRLASGKFDESGFLAAAGTRAKRPTCGYAFDFNWIPHVEAIPASVHSVLWAYIFVVKAELQSEMERQCMLQLHHRLRR